MRDYEVVLSLYGDAIRSLEARAEALRDQIGSHGGRDQEAEWRLEVIERVLRRLYGEGVGDAR
jgi:hypothetical protein